MNPAHSVPTSTELEAGNAFQVPMRALLNGCCAPTATFGSKDWVEAPGGAASLKWWRWK
jgi:hypothetical protein